jgi:nickel/cobalt transporter (NicO) family protein
VLGVSGGIIPCWDAIAMLGFAIAAQRLWLGLPLLIAFSAGLAGVLVAIGVVVVLTKNRLGRRWSDSRLWKALPILSAAVLVVMGLWLCRDSLLTPGPG